MNVPINKYYSATLVDPKDLPFPLSKLPDVYSQFRTQIEGARDDIVGEPLPDLKELKGTPPKSVLDTIGELPFIRDIREYAKYLYNDKPKDERSAFPFTGGETAALERLNDYLWGTNAVKEYKETRNGLVGHQYSTKFSPWLATGSLSARTIISRLTDYEQERGANKSTYWVWFELLYVIHYLPCNINEIDGANISSLSHSSTGINCSLKRD